MKIAYLFMAYKNASIVEKTISFLSAGSGVNDCFFLHIDKDSIEDFSSLNKIPNVFFAQRRFRTKWGSPELAFAVASSMIELSSFTKFDYVVLLSESDLPVKTPDYIHAFLQNSNCDHILCNPLPCENPLGVPNCKWIEGGRRRIACYSFRLNDKNIATVEPRSLSFNNFKQLIKVLRYNPMLIKDIMKCFLFAKKREHPKSLIPCGGHQWFILRSTTIKRIINYLESHPDYIEYCKDTQILDEIFFSTLVFNIVDHSEIDNDILRYIKWNSGNSPDCFNESDYSLLQQCVSSKNTLLIRKVDSIQMTDVILNIVKKSSIEHYSYDT